MGCLISIEARDLNYCIPSHPFEIRVGSIDELPSGLLPPLIFTPTLPNPDEEFFFQLAAKGPRYLDIPYTIPSSLFSKLKLHFPDIQLIASFHDYESTPEHLSEIFEKLRLLPCDVIKIVTFAHSGLDGLRMLDFLRCHSSKFPLIAFCMGEKGAFTRILQPLYGGVFTYAAREKGLETAAGQLTFDELTQMYSYHQLSLISLPYALLGNPLDQSLSPITHNALFRQYNMDAVYVKIVLIEKEFNQALYYLQRLRFAGLSITMPLKFCFDNSIPVNTVDIRGQSMRMCNTDGIAAVEAMADKLELPGKKMLIIGTGATAEAIALQAIERDIEVYIQGRNQDRLQELQEKIGCKIAYSSVENMDIVINATPVDILFEKSIQLALDVRNFGTTPFLESAIGRGGKAISGQEMWLRQAAKQLALWCLSPPVTLALPPSKSQTLRAILFATFASGISYIKNILPSPDTESMIQACQALGATIERDDNSLTITGIADVRNLQSNQIDVGNSGITLRFIAAVAALFDEPLTIIGDASTQKRRSCTPLLEGLAQLGAAIISHSDGHTPICIRGPIQSGSAIIDGHDSQPVSALLIACSLIYGRGESKLTVKNLGEKPWVQLTVNWLRKVGVTIREDEEFSTFYIQNHHNACFSPFTYTVPGDLSSLAFMIVAALVREIDLIITGVDLQDLQGDKKIIQILEAMGASFAIDVRQQRLRVRGPQKLHGIRINVNECIDTLPILAVVGTYAMGVTTISGAAIARDKECDRLASITLELRKMGAKIEEHQDGLIIHQSSLHAASLESHHDHRIAMSLAVAALRVQEPCTITGSECVQKSYPQFFTELARLFNT